jgi:hypothetical protein
MHAMRYYYILLITHLFWQLISLLNSYLWYTAYYLLVWLIQKSLRQRLESICELHAIGWGYKCIHKRYPWVSLSGIRYTIKKESERRMGITKPRSGRPKKLTEEDKSRILYVIAEQPRVTYKDLLSEVS